MTDTPAPADNQPDNQPDDQPLQHPHVHTEADLRALHGDDFTGPTREEIDALDAHLTKQHPEVSVWDSADDETRVGAHMRAHDLHDGTAEFWAQVFAEAGIKRPEDQVADAHAAIDTAGRYLGDAVLRIEELARALGARTDMLWSERPEQQKQVLDAYSLVHAAQKALGDLLEAHRDTPGHRGHQPTPATKAARRDPDWLYNGESGALYGPSPVPGERIRRIIATEVDPRYGYAIATVMNATAMNGTAMSAAPESGEGA